MIDALDHVNDEGEAANKAAHCTGEAASLQCRGVEFTTLGSLRTLLVLWAAVTKSLERNAAGIH